MKAHLVGLRESFSDQRTCPLDDDPADRCIGRQRRQEQRQSKRVVLDLKHDGGSCATAVDEARGSVLGQERLTLGIEPPRDVPHLVDVQDAGREQPVEDARVGVTSRLSSRIGPVTDGLEEREARAGQIGLGRLVPEELGKKVGHDRELVFLLAGRKDVYDLDERAHGLLDERDAD